jgi:hypothetical protein
VASLGAKVRNLHSKALTRLFDDMHPYKKGGIRRLIYSKEGENGYKEEEVIQKEEERADDNAAGQRKASAGLQSPSNSSDSDDSSSGVGQGLTGKKGSRAKQKEASPLEPATQEVHCEFGGESEDTTDDAASVETAELAKRCKPKDKDGKEKVRRGRRDGRMHANAWLFKRCLFLPRTKQAGGTVSHGGLGSSPETLRWSSDTFVWCRSLHVDETEAIFRTGSGAWPQRHRKCVSRRNG